jgi:hypothetical protein
MPLNIEFPLCVVDEELAAVALRIGVALVDWHEQGLGQASGFFLESRDRPALRAEQLHERPNQDPKGFTVYVEAQFLAQVGVDSAIREAMNLLRIDEASLSWVQSAEGQAAAAALVNQQLGSNQE